LEFRRPCHSGFATVPLAAIVCAVLCVSTACATPYSSYTYDAWGQMVESPEPYLPYLILDGDDLGVGPLKSPQDLCVTPNGTVLLLDSGNNRIICLDTDWNVIKVIDAFDNGGKIDRLSQPQGIAVDASGNVYIADTGNGRLVVLDSEGRFLKVLGRPTTGVDGAFDEKIEYRPKKVAVNPLGRIFVIAEGVYDGLVEIDGNGEFKGFYGTPRVVVNPIELFWRRIATREQIERMTLVLPVDYSNVHVGPRGLLYATISSTQVDTEKGYVRLLNYSGEDVLVRVGQVPIVGDVLYPQSVSASVSGPSVFVDIATLGSDGVYTALDRKRGRVFAYDKLGNLLFVFGANSSQAGTFRQPVAIDTIGYDIVVLDASKNRLTVFRPTEYGKSILGAMALENRGAYDLAAQLWRNVLSFNANLDVAFRGVGRALLRESDYEQALRYFRLGNDREAYSDALSVYRSQVISDNFGLIATTIVTGIGLLWVVLRWRAAIAAFLSSLIARTVAAVQQRVKKSGLQSLPGSRNTLNESQEAGAAGGLRAWLRDVFQSIGFAFYVIVHPFDGFERLKQRRRGTLPAAVVLLVLVGLTYVFMRQYTGFLFNPRDVTTINFYMEMASIVVPFVTFCIVNWALTTLMDGKGTIKQIFVACAYALVPLIVVNIPLTIVSNWLTLPEAAFYYQGLSIGVIWAGALVIIGLMTTHEFGGAGQTVFTIALTAVGIGVVFFLGLLLFSLVDAMAVFAQTLYWELVYRFRL